MQPQTRPDVVPPLSLPGEGQQMKKPVNASVSPKKELKSDVEGKKAAVADFDDDDSGDDYDGVDSEEPPEDGDFGFDDMF